MRISSLGPQVRQAVFKGAMRIRMILSWGLALLALSAQVTLAQNLEDLVQRLVRQTDMLAQPATQL